MPHDAVNRYKVTVQAEGVLMAIQAYTVISLIENSMLISSIF